MRGALLCAALALLGFADPQSKPAPVDPDKAAEPKRDPQAPPPAEYTLSANEGAWRVRVTLRPGEPQPGQMLELLLDVARKPDSTDPTFGDRIPVQGATLELLMSGPAASERHRLWPLGDAGIYGAHWTPAARGLWTVQLAPVSGKPDEPRASFQVGVGVPMPASSEGQAVRSARVVLGGDRPAQPGKPLLRDQMRELTRHWVAMDRPDADYKKELVASLPVLDSLPGSVPQRHAADAAEYDALVKQLRADYERVAAAKPEAQPAIRRDAERDTCLKCHLKFRDDLVTDLSAWPEVKPWKK